MSAIKNVIETTANNLVSLNKASKESFLTGETNLVLTSDELEERLLSLKNGKSYLGVWLIEGTILRSQGVIKTKILADKTIFIIPDWDNFISRVNAFHVACGPY